jgi:hypothetical protein
MSALNAHGMMLDSKASAVKGFMKTMSEKDGYGAEKPHVEALKECHAEEVSPVTRA